MSRDNAIVEMELAEGLNDEETDDIVPLHDVVFEEANLKVSEWIEGLTCGQHGLGGVHSGRVVLSLHPNMNGKIAFQEQRLDKEVCGGQIYTPFFEQLLQKNILRNHNTLGAIPALTRFTMCVWSSWREPHKTATR